MQSRPRSVKCRVNRELSPGRKEELFMKVLLAVPQPHPAATYRAPSLGISLCSSRITKEVFFYGKT